MSNKAIGAENQQATPKNRFAISGESSETICQTPFTKSEIITYLNGKIMYLRGFFDAEGGIPRVVGRFYIQLTQKDYKKTAISKQKS